MAYNHIMAFGAVTPCACWYSHSGGKHYNYFRDELDSCGWSYDPLTSCLERGIESNNRKKTCNPKGSLSPKIASSGVSF